MSRRELWFWGVAVALSVLLPGCLSLHTGDDLGYMFADSVHHGCDGPRVTSLWQCVTTQCSHYTTTNGRWLVHVTVMALLNLVPLWLYRVLNACVAALAWLAVVRLTKRTPAACALSWLLITAAWPLPGMVLTTLVSYSVNYLWVSCAMLWLIVAMRGPVRWWLFPAAFVCGTLHEGWSLPMCAAMLCAVLLRRGNLWLMLCFAAGTAVCALAPGNMAHAAQGGGFTLSSVMRKVQALGAYLPYSIVLWSAVAGGVVALVKPRTAWTFVKDNAEWLVLVAASVALAVLTFTSARQLSCAAVGCMVLLLRALPLRRGAWLWAAAAVAWSVTLFCVKWPVYHRWQAVVQQVNEGRGAVVFGTAEPYTPRLGSWIAPDPLSNTGLQCPGDRYTRQGLERLRASGRLTAILPYTQQSIRNCAPAQAFMTAPCGAYRVTRVPRGSRVAPGIRVLESFAVSDSTYWLLEPNAPARVGKQ